MDFKNYFSIMKNWISDGVDVPRFFRGLVTMITDVINEVRLKPHCQSWKIKHAPHIYKAWYFKDVCTEYCLQIIFRDDHEAPKSRPEATLALLADNDVCYYPTAMAENIAKKLANCFVEIIL